MKKKALGYYDYTVILTYCGMLFAFLGILQAINQGYWQASVCLMLAGVCDMFDGAVASTRERTVSEKRFGIQIDSLSDLISFGVLPGIFVYKISNQSILAGMVAALFVLCALIRLAYFNVLEEERQNQTSGKRKSYLGVPVTTIAILLPVFYILYDYRVWKSSICFQILLVVLGAGFLAPFEIKKPGFRGKICIILVGMMEAVGILFYSIGRIR